MKILTALLLALLLIPANGIAESALADGKRPHHRHARCLTVSNGRVLLRINCDAARTVQFERGTFPFGVIFGAGVSDDDTGDRPRRRGRDRDRGNGRDCHPAYRGCLPIVDDLNCEDINHRQVRLRDPADDPYGLDVANGVGNGITCDDVG